jgi:hypothetical protein
MGILTAKGLFIAAPVSLTVLIALLAIFWSRCEHVWRETGTDILLPMDGSAAIWGLKESGEAGTEGKGCEKWRSPALWKEPETIRWE